MLERVKKIIVEYVDVDPDKITEQTNLRMDLGMTSISLMNMIVDVEEEFGLEIDEADIMEFQVLGDVLEHLKQNATK